MFNLFKTSQWLSHLILSSGQVRRPAVRRTLRQWVRVGVEPLEERLPLAGNLKITDAFISDSSGNKLSPPPVGALVYVTAKFDTSSLAANAQYAIKYTLDGVSKSTALLNWGAGSASKSWTATWGDWLMKPGPHSVTVQLDSTAKVAESSEADNVKTFSVTGGTFKSAYANQKFITPIAGIPYGNWTIVNYVDLDSGSGFKDYKGGKRAYDGHNGIDYTLAGMQTNARFIGMDVGVPLLAAADGVVTSIKDGFFDRNDSSNKPYDLSGGNGGNFVKISHGNGWETIYYHMRKNSVAVSVGDFVQADTLLGLTGSSGNSSDPHLHFEVRFNNVVVEPFVDPNSYWVSPLAYPPLSKNLTHYYENHITENGGSVTINVPNPNLNGAPATVDYNTQALSALPGEDYSQTSGTLQFASGQLSKTVTIPILNDALHETRQNFVVAFDGDARYSEHVTIIDDDQLLNFNKVTGVLTVNAATGRETDVITFDVSSTQFTVNLYKVVNFPVAGVKSVILNSGDGADTINILATRTGVPITVNAGTGVNTINVGKPDGVLKTRYSIGGIQGQLTVKGSTETDTMNVKDNDASNTGRSYTLTSNSVSRPGVAKISYDSIESVVVNAGGGSDTFTVSSMLSSTVVTLDGGGGGTDTLVGPNTANAWQITGIDFGGLNSTVKFKSVENLTGGTNSDSFQWQSFEWVGLTGTLKGGSGTDTLDLSLASSAVTVNLTAGTYGGVVGGISAIENVLGGAGNDILTGDSADNILNGGGGSDTLLGLGGADILIGGTGNDKLQGGDGRDFLIGGWGADNLVGGLSDDILFGGTTAYDARTNVLSLMLAEWKSGLTYTQRINKLRNVGVGPSLSKLNSSVVVVADAAVDQLFGGSDTTDWFWAAPSGVFTDTTDKAASETVN